MPNRSRGIQQKSIDLAAISLKLQIAADKAAHGHKEQRQCFAIRVADLNRLATKQIEEYCKFCCDPISFQRGRYPDLKPAQPSYWEDARKAVLQFLGWCTRFCDLGQLPRDFSLCAHLSIVANYLAYLIERGRQFVYVVNQLLHIRKVAQCLAVSPSSTQKQKQDAHEAYLHMQILGKQLKRMLKSQQSSDPTCPGSSCSLTFMRGLSAPELTRRLLDLRALVIRAADAAAKKHGVGSLEAASAAVDMVLAWWVVLGIPPIRLSCIASLKAPEYAHEPCVELNCSIRGCKGNRLEVRDGKLCAIVPHHKNKGQTILFMLPPQMQEALKSYLAYQRPVLVLAAEGKMRTTRRQSRGSASSVASGSKRSQPELPSSPASKRQKTAAHSQQANGAGCSSSGRSSARAAEEGAVARRSRYSTLVVSDSDGHRTPARCRQDQAVVVARSPSGKTRAEPAEWEGARQGRSMARPVPAQCRTRSHSRGAAAEALGKLPSSRHSNMAALRALPETPGAPQRGRSQQRSPESLVQEGMAARRGASQSREAEAGLPRPLSRPKHEHSGSAPARGRSMARPEPGQRRTRSHIRGAAAEALGDLPSSRCNVRTTLRALPEIPGAPQRSRSRQRASESLPQEDVAPRRSASQSRDADVGLPRPSARPALERSGPAPARGRSRSRGPEARARAAGAEAAEAGPSGANAPAADNPSNPSTTARSLLPAHKALLIHPKQHRAMGIRDMSARWRRIIKEHGEKADLHYFNPQRIRTVFAKTLTHLQSSQEHGLTLHDATTIMGNSVKTIQERYIPGDRQEAMQRAVDAMEGFTKAARGDGKGGKAGRRAAQRR